MEDTKSLLMMVLQKVFHNRPKIVEETFQLIYNYNNGKREKKEYEKTLKTICDLMNDELSSQILVYLLTMVDMPKEGGCQLPIMEKMQKTHGCLAESVRPHLLDCLKKRRPESDECEVVYEKNKYIVQKRKTEPPNDSKSTIKVTPPQQSSVINHDPPQKQIKRARKINKEVRKKDQPPEDDDETKNVETLAQLSANCCVRYEAELRKMYKTKLNKAWNMLYKRVLDKPTTNKIYEVIKHLNRMMRLVRMVENNDVTIDLIKEEYPDVEILARIRHQQEFQNPFDEIDKYLSAMKKN